jgi:ribosomal protein L11 methyltransferase
VLLAALESFDPGLDWTQAHFRNVEDQDWERAWMDQYVPLSFGARTWIVPWNRELPEGADAHDAAVVRLDPGLAFGSGTHPTTSLCLQWLDALAEAGELQGRAVLDFGCGSGILALAALEARRATRGRRGQRSAGADRHARQRRSQRRGRTAVGVPAGRTNP